MHVDVVNGIVTLVALGAAAQWLAWRWKIPSILVLLAVGFTAGPITGLFQPEEVLGSLTFPFVSLAAAVVLFEGGLTATWDEIRGVATPVRRLILIGIPMTWGVLSAAGYYLLDLRLELALLLGAILVVTGPTVIGPLLRHARPRGKVGSVLKLEGIINDPIGAVLAVLVFQGMKAEEVDRAFSVVSAGILKAVLLSCALGFAAAVLFIKFRQRDLLPEFLHNAVILPFSLVVYATANEIQGESGLLAVTVMGIALGSQKSISIEKSLEFTEHARILLISALFILLTARMQISDITNLPLAVLGFVAVVILVARPLAVLSSTWRTDLSRQERIFLSSMAPRGVVAAAVSSLFSLELVDAGYADAAILMPVTFAVIALTVLVSGLSAVPLVRWLGLAQSSPQGVLFLGASLIGRTIARAVQQRGFRVLLVDSDPEKVRLARELGLESVAGQLLTRRVLKGLDLDGIGHLVALTPNDDANMLAVAHFRSLFGESNLHQIQPSTGRGRPQPGYASDLQVGHIGGGVTLEKLEALATAGATVTGTSLAGLQGEDFRNRFGANAIPLFIVSEDGTLDFVHTEDELPTSGELFILAPA